MHRLTSKQQASAARVASRPNITSRSRAITVPVRANAVDDVVSGVLRIFSPSEERSAPIVPSSFVGEKSQRKSRAATRGKPDLTSPVKKAASLKAKTIGTEETAVAQSNNIVSFFGTLLTRNFTSDDTEPSVWPENNYKGGKRAVKKPFADGWVSKK